MIGALLKQLLQLPLCRWSWVRFLSVRVWKPEPTAESAHDRDFPDGAVDDLGKRDFRGVALRSAYGLPPRNAAAPPPTPRPGTRPGVPH